MLHDLYGRVRDLTEDLAFVEAVRTGNPAGIRSPYADAFRTFELTWAITDAASGKPG